MIFICLLNIILSFYDIMYFNYKFINFGLLNPSLETCISNVYHYVLYIYIYIYIYIIV
jgi:hypothetical protein